MAHGKETPRQKMIGMMYLVLTALLALNVSKEVLNAFATLDTGLIGTLQNVEASNNKVISDFEVQYQMNQKKVEPWKVKAVKVSEMAKDITSFIQEKKLEMVKKADGKKSEAIKDGEIDDILISAKDNTDAPAEVMIGDRNDKAGRELRLKIEAFRKYLTDEVVTTEGAEAIRHSIEVSLNTEPNRKEIHKSDAPTWEAEHFEHLPLAGVLTIMSGLQINVRNAETEALRYLYNQIDAGSFKFNQLEATVIPNSNYIIRGNEYRAEVFLAASDTTASPTVWVTSNSRPYDSTVTDGITSYSKRADLSYDTLPVNKGGKGIYSIPGSALGMKYWGGLIELTGPDGSKLVKPFRRDYLVAEGSVVVSPTKMNVFYLGVDNPVDVSVAGVQPDQVEISVTNARHEKQGGSSYIIRPIRPGNAFVVVYANIEGRKREMGRKEFRVKTVPAPVTMVNNQKGGYINQGVLLAQIGVIAEMENFEFDLKFTITEFTVSAVVQGFVREYTSKTNKFTADQKALIKTLSRGNSVYIQDVKAVGPDGSTRNLSTINFKLN
jgi:gliding motility-associated protein GldM